MCGIAGVWVHGRERPSLEMVGRMGAALHHRGPDGAGLYRDAECGLAHTRLAIIDPAGGAQPICADDGSVLVFNGEVFNHVELREELRALGSTFRTRSDAEVVLEALRRWGESALLRFNGQFALAWWRPRDRVLVLARDRFGVRPLYVTEHRDQLLFASEVKALFAADPTLPRELDPDGLAETFTFWTVVAPRTVFRGIEELPPGYVRTYSATGYVERCYWEPRFEETFRGSVADAAAALSAELERATSLLVTRSDVPVGCYLSGGLDSSVIAALAQRAHRDKLPTFSLRFADPEYDEGAFQQAMVRQLDSDHRELVITRDHIAEVFPEVIRHVERPLLRTAAAPLLLLSRLVHQSGIKTVLTGEGADELFAGYELFREARVRRFWARDPSSTSRPRLLERLYPYLARSPMAARAMAREFFARGLDQPGAPDFAHGPRWRSTSALHRLFVPELRWRDPAARVIQLCATFPDDLAGWDPLARDQYVEIRTLLSSYLLPAQGDRVAQANAVEGRFPYLDPGVVALACSLPAEHKLHVLDEKHVLKRAAAGLVPAEIVRRSKQPYRAPDALAFIGPNRPAWIDEVLSRRAIEDAGVFDADTVSRLWTKCQAASTQLSNNDNMGLIGVLSTQLLHRELVRRPIDPTPLADPLVIDRLADRP